MKKCKAKFVFNTMVSKRWDGMPGLRRPAGRGESGGLKKFPGFACNVLGGTIAADELQSLRCRQALVNEAFNGNQDGGRLVAAGGGQDLIQQCGDLSLLGGHDWLAVVDSRWLSRPRCRYSSARDQPGNGLPRSVHNPSHWLVSNARYRSRNLAPDRSRTHTPPQQISQQQPPASSATTCRRSASADWGTS